MDTESVSPVREALRIVSMGPQPLGHGYHLVVRIPQFLLQGGFKWGHNLSVMDTLTERSLTVTFNDKFQWGHNLSVMDTAQMVRDGAAFTYRFQWGHNLSVMDTRG